MELKTVIGIIKDLSNKTVAKGCTEHEAMSAIEKVGQLLRVYNLSMDQVFLGEAKCVTVAVETDGRRQSQIKGCVVAISSFCDCKAWCGWSNKGTVTYNFFGLEPDTSMVKYLYSIIEDAIETETIKFKNSDTYRHATQHRKRLFTSFQFGMVQRVSARLNEMTCARHREEEKVVMPFRVEPDWAKPTAVAPATTGTNLVVVKKKKVEDEFKTLNMKLKKGTSVRVYTHHDAYNAGKTAGDRVNLHRPLNGAVTGFLGCE